MLRTSATLVTVDNMTDTATLELANGLVLVHYRDADTATVLHHGMRCGHITRDASGWTAVDNDLGVHPTAEAAATAVRDHALLGAI